MLDLSVRRRIDPVLDRIGAALAARGVGADGVTLAGFAIGVLAAVAIATESYVLGLVLVVASRLCDGLDGAVARATRPTDFGGLLDIVLDFAFYGFVPLAFVLADPQQNAIAGAVLLVTFYVNGASFLAFALMVEKRGVDAKGRGRKAFLYTVGLVEGTETILFFCVLCLVPALFAPLAYAFAALTIATTLARLALAWTTFRDGATP